MKTGIGFETHLLDSGWKVYCNSESDFFNTYNHTSRLYTKNGLRVVIGLWSKGGGAMVGILEPCLNTFPFIPEPKDYKQTEQDIINYYEEN